MGTFSTNILPSNTGQDLGSPSQEWDAYLQDLTVSGDLTLAGTLNSNGALAASFANLSVGTLNNVRYVDGVRFLTIAAAIADLPASGGMVVTPPAYRETITSNVNLGSSTQQVCLALSPDTMLTVNITDGISDAFTLHRGSCITGMSVGQLASTSGGASITVAATANFGWIINAGDTATGISFVLLEKFFINGLGHGVFTGAINFNGILNQGAIRDVFIANCPAIGVKVSSNANAVCGPVILDNVWVNGGNAAGAKPLVISSTTSSCLGITVLGGIYNNPAAGGNCIEITGDGADRLRDVYINTYCEDLTGASTIGIKITDASNVTVASTEISLNGAGTKAVDISQTVAGRVKAIQVIGLRSSGVSVIAINNQITSEAIGASTAYVPWYNYGTDGTGISPFGPIFSNNRTLQLGKFNNSASGLADVAIIPSSPATKRPLLVRNFSDNSMNVDLDTGSTATQAASLRFLDRGTAEWLVQKTSANAFLIQDSVNAKTRLSILQAATGATVNLSRVGYNLSTALVAGDFAASAGWGTTPTITVVGGKDGAASITILAQATTGSSPTITLTFKDGTWTSAPIVVATRTDVAAATAVPGATVTNQWAVTSVTATTAVFTFNGQPVAGNTYGLAFCCFGI